MNHNYHLQIFLLFLLILSITSRRPLFYDQLNSDDETDLFSNEYEERRDFRSKLADTIVKQADELKFNSYEKRKLHQRSTLNTSPASQTRQQFIDILRQAYQQGWRPSIKHYIPATRFGRHRR